jgi:hypothetical protein
VVYGFEDPVIPAAAKERFARRHPEPYFEFHFSSQSRSPAVSTSLREENRRSAMSKF